MPNRDVITRTNPDGSQEDIYRDAPGTDGIPRLYEDADRIYFEKFGRNLNRWERPRQGVDHVDDKKIYHTQVWETPYLPGYQWYFRREWFDTIPERI